MRLPLLLPLVLVACSSPAKPMHPPREPAPPAAPPAQLALETLQPGVPVRGFTPTAVYLDGSDRPIGARFIHDTTKFTFDYVRIESAPQGYLWVNSFPTSDKGEPHTQEHLLLGKGDRGRRMGSFQAMALAESSAFTDQWRTVYHFHTVAGRDTFWPVFADQLGAMLDADYTDEEIRREVRNFGVDKDPKGALRLEEKGTVYNEMVRSYESPDAVLWRHATRLVYGPKHPLAFESGGYPDDIRAMTVEDIRTFHTDNYHLANMGMIATFPSSLSLTQVLDEANTVLVAANPRKGTVKTEADLPKPQLAKGDSISVVEYPFSDATSPSPVMLVWPATRDLPIAERVLLELFLDAFAGDESTTLYRKLIDSTTRTMDIGASGVGGFVSNQQGQPVFISLNGVRADKLDTETLAKVRAEVTAELARIAKLPATDPELIALDKRVQSRVVDLRRRVAKFLDSPPGFGTRGTGPDWDYHLHALSKVSGFTKSLTLRPELTQIDTLLAAGGNPWTSRLGAWGLLETPLVVAARPSPKLRASLDAARDQRISDELARLQKRYGTKDAPSTLAKYQVEYDAQTRLLEDAAAKVELPPLVKSPPMTLDDELKYQMTPIRNVPAFAATFESMQSSRVSLAFRVDAVPESDLMYLALLPWLMSEVGIAHGTTVIASDEMQERLRKEILELEVGYDHDLRTGRVELFIAGAGNDAGETKLALGWMERVMFAPDWRIENLPRIRDLVDQTLTRWKQRMKGAEESWVLSPQQAWWKQENPLLLHTNSFLTQSHDLHRLRWQLLDPRDPKVTAEVTTFLGQLAGASKLPRKTLVQLATALADPKAKVKAPARYLALAKTLSPAAAPLVVAAGKDLASLLAELPEDSLAADWAYLCKQMAADLAIGAPAALAKLTSVRQAVLATSTARVVSVGSSASHAALAPAIAAVLDKLDTAPRPRATYAKAAPIRERLAARSKARGEATYVGLFAPGTSSGVFLNTAPATSLLDTGDDAILDFLASNQYTGHGAHSLFMKTWAAGLAYSNGARIHEADGFLMYYAERCPLLPQTLQFVIAQIKAAKPDPNIARYAIAEAFDSRIANDYEGRAWDMAANIVDGLTPEAVRTFRTRVLAQAERADLATVLNARLPSVYGRIMPGYGTPANSSINFVIGPAKQLDAYQAYLRATVGKDVTLHRLYARDYWIPAKL